jgi:hypothetical protein
MLGPSYLLERVEPLPSRVVRLCGDMQADGEYSRGAEPEDSDFPSPGIYGPCSYVLELAYGVSTA